MKKIIYWRWTFYVIGLIVLALGISMTIKGYRLGVGPWDVFHIGLQQNLGLTIGSWSIISGLVIVVVTAYYLKKWPQLGTWLNMVLLGLFIDFFNWIIPDFESLSAQTIIFVLGVIVMSYGVGLYVSPNMGAGPRDSLMLIFVEKFGISIKVVRTAIEVIVAILGWILGGPVGIGTVVIALFIGQFVHFTLPQSRKLLMKILKETDENILT